MISWTGLIPELHREAEAALQADPLVLYITLLNKIVGVTILYLGFIARIAAGSTTLKVFFPRCEPLPAHSPHVPRVRL